MNLQLYIGQTQLRGGMSRYAAHYNLLEFRGEARQVPRTSVLQRWRAEVPDSFVFAWLLDREVGRLNGDCRVLVEQAISSARALEARWLVLQTDPAVGPSQRTRTRLGVLFSRLTDSGMRLAWEPHGIWQLDEAVAFAQECGVLCARDISRGDPTSEHVVYSRLPGLGTAARLSVSALEKSVKNLAGASEAYIVAAGDGARKLKQLLPGLLSAESQAGPSGNHGVNSVQVFGADGGELDDDEDDGLCAYDSEDDLESAEEGADWDAEDLRNRTKGTSGGRSTDESSRTGRRSK